MLTHSKAAQATAIHIIQMPQCGTVDIVNQLVDNVLH